jgi:hypothetical protein
MDWELLVAAMDFTQDEQAVEILLHCISGLKRAELIDFEVYGDPEYINTNGREKWRKIEGLSIEWAIPVRPTQMGIEFWLWANGAGHMSVLEFFNENAVIEEIEGVDIARKPFKLNVHFDSKQ